jgi:L-lactate dehydrogenase complex protein LldG
VGKAAGGAWGPETKLSELVSREQNTPMTSRDTILAAVRANQPKTAPAIPTIPMFERASSRSLIEDFGEALVSMGGKFVPVLDGKPLDVLLKSLFPDAEIVCSATPEILGTRVIDQ